MAYKCFNCGKGNWLGKRSQHHKGVAGGAWKHRAQKSTKLFKANLHKIKVLYDGAVKRLKLCTDCSSLLRKNKRLPHILLANTQPVSKPIAYTLENVPAITPSRLI